MGDSDDSIIPYLGNNEDVGENNGGIKWETSERLKVENRNEFFFNEYSVVPSTIWSP